MVCKRLNLKYELIKEANGKTSLFIFGLDNSNSFLRVPVSIKNYKELIYYEVARKKLLIIKKEQDRIKRLEKIKNEIEEVKRAAEAEYVSNLSKEDFNLYFNWVSTL